MPLITWKDEYSIGVAALDRDHRQLMDIINDLHDGFVGGAGPEALGVLCDSLIAHTVEHFAHEEAEFEGYPGAEEHRRMHDKLRQRVQDYRNEIGTPGAADGAKLITDWLAHHITGEDKTFGAWLNTQGIH